MRDRIWSPLQATNFRDYSMILAVSARRNQESGAGSQELQEFRSQEPGVRQFKELGVDGRPGELRTPKSSRAPAGGMLLAPDSCNS